VKVHRQRPLDDGLPPELGDAAEEYHVSTRNPSTSKGFIKAHEFHYSQFVQQLTSEAPLRLGGTDRVALPERRRATLPVDDAVTTRRSGRSFGTTPLAAEDLASVLFLANGVRRSQAYGESVFHERNVPSSGNLGSVEIFPVVMSAAGIPPGIYHFDTIEDDLVRLHSGAYRTWLRERVLFQSEFPEASVALILTSAIGRLKAKYGARGYRFGHIDVGHVSAHVYMAAIGLGLQVCATAGFIDDELERALGLDGLDVCPMLVLLVGTPPDPQVRT